MANEIKNWSNVDGKMRVAYNVDIDACSTQISKKDKKGNYENMFISVFFVGDDNKEKMNNIVDDLIDDGKQKGNFINFNIDVTEGWLSFYNDKVQVIVSKFNKLADDEPKKQESGRRNRRR